MTLQATVSLGWVNTVLAAAERQGVSRAALLAQAGLPPGALAQERWPMDHITRLWRAAAAATGNPGFGLQVGLQAGPQSFGSVDGLLQSSATLRQAIAAVQRYQRLISDGGRFQLIAGQGAGWLVYHPRQGLLAFSPHQIEAVLAAVVTFAGWVLGAPVQALSVQFSQPRLGPLAGYRATFGCPVAFEQAFSGVLLDNAVLDAPLPRADALSQRLHGRHAAARLAALSAGGALVRELRAWLEAALQAGHLPTRAQAAQALLVSERTLARRMRDEDLSFSGLLDEVRRASALQAVAEGRGTLAEISQSLGYAEPSVFWRAFRRWTGCTPAQWRKGTGLSAPVGAMSQAPELVRQLDG
ncbi:AraC family transcriptional regulator [Melaminivora sp.]|uniref:AraC family transcriptional regulator n=1 Tax=Melaminivora sp. TaxID=1933032 RepID=UPI0028A820A1|nr:AraC family transcriptional regulator [Melaminivora sp.]